MKKNQKGTWRQALLTFFGPVLLVFVFRFFILEPFVIPSGSMIPNLLIHDHLMVLKGSYGIKSPFKDIWWVRWNEPRHGDIVVFRYPENPKVFYIKRVIGLPGDKITFENHRLKVNGTEWPVKRWVQPNEQDEEEFDVFLEKGPIKTYFVRYMRGDGEPDAHTRFEITVPAKKYFMMGDNRDQSSDSRIWGFVPEAFLVGRAWFIWLSCENTLVSAQMVCDPFQIRWNRLFKSVDKTIDFK